MSQGRGEALVGLSGKVMVGGSFFPAAADVDIAGGHGYSGTGSTGTYIGSGGRTGYAGVGSNAYVLGASVGGQNWLSSACSIYESASHFAVIPSGLNWNTGDRVPSGASPIAVGGGTAWPVFFWSTVSSIVVVPDERRRPASDTSDPTVVDLNEYRQLHQTPSGSATPVEELTQPLTDDPASRLAVKQIVSDYLGELETEESLENIGDAISSLIDEHGVAGIAALDSQLLRPNAEPLWWKFLNALGTRRGSPADDAARRVLLSHLNSAFPGRRAAAVSALGAYRDGGILTALEQRVGVETNRVVLATLKAHIRARRRNGLPIATTA